ncbi:LptF/LptG family permease [Fodinibius halophilus]|uniref:YjgP/YjgQ family permease n=1 Tax=Fodinibius halophilus TaxID=1736908 RepID=A0A6M1TDK5_9BACT|nr:LptF/LptG family permease [Fodinibius halophilus]NGP86780.1 YjgP/YjgQ family permease [Fodinibius halophilus]
MRFIPNKLQLDVLRRHLGPFVFCFFTLMFLLLMQFLILYIDMLVGKGLPLGIILELIVTNLASMVVLAVPMAVLVACLMAYGKFTELNELTAIRAAGINPFHVITPVLTAATLLSIFLVWFSNDVLPDANQRARSLFIDIRLKKPGFDLKPEEFYEGIDNYTFLVERITHESDSLHDVTIFQHATRNRKEAIIKAQKGNLNSEADGQTLTLYLKDGSILRKMDHRRDQKSIKVFEETDFNRYRISFDLSELAFSRSNPENRSRNDRTMDIKAMMTVVDSLQKAIVAQKQSILDDKSHIIPYKESTNNRIPNRAITTDTLEKKVKSEFIALQHLETRSEQKHLKSNALTFLRNYKSKLSDIATNTEWRISKIAQYLVEVHKKFSIPIACIVFVLIGAPIGMYTKKGNLGYAALIGTIFLTFYWISIIQGEKLADRLFITPFTGMWFSNILLGIIGLYLTIRFCTSFKFSNLWKNRG